MTTSTGYLAPMPIRDGARVEAARTRTFADMGQAARRWGSFWMIFIHGCVLVGLVAGGSSALRIGVQAVTLAVAIPFSIMMGRQTLFARQNVCALPVGTALYLTNVANTGGVASPFVLFGVPLLFGTALMPIQENVRRSVLGAFVVGFIAMSLGQSGLAGDYLHAGPPLHFAPAIYVLLTTGTVALVVIKVRHIGQNLSHVYHRVAIELGASREELCDESADRTRALEGVAARLAHEVKNPLAAIKGLSTHMARNASDPKMAERLGIVAQEADRLKEIVDGFLSFSRGLEEMQVAAMRPFEVARELSVLLEIRAADVGVTLEVTGSAELEVNADRRKVRQVLHNLVLNAVQASPKGQSVQIDVDRGVLGGSRIRVIDRGSGMSAEILERIRRPYFTTREGGTGLGVAVARGLVEQHGGELKYESRPGVGTTVTIELPPCAHAIAKLHKLPDPAKNPQTPCAQHPFTRTN
jgi:signal transduction histidine kinase